MRSTSFCPTQSLSLTNYSTTVGVTMFQFGEFLAKVRAARSSCTRMP